MWLLLCWIAALASALEVPVARAFSLEGGQDDRLEMIVGGQAVGSARWDARGESLVAQGRRGLGGGLEYTVEGAFCEGLLPRFIDDQVPTCDELRQVIARTIAAWGEGQPAIAFVEVTGRVPASLEPAGGAEIDFYALPSPEGSAAQRAGQALVRSQLARPLTLTNGQTTSGVAIQSVDVVINTAQCWSLDRTLSLRELQAKGRARGCTLTGFLDAVVLHEVGHALGLGHPDNDPNFDLDDDPRNPMPIDCLAPARGLRRALRFDPTAAMISSSSGRPAVLKADDLAGRDFLYPLAHCPPPGEAVAQPEPAAGDGAQDEHASGALAVIGTRMLREQGELLASGYFWNDSAVPRRDLHLTATFLDQQGAGQAVAELRLPWLAAGELAPWELRVPDQPGIKGVSFTWSSG
jgi:hypothetical protein